MQNIEKNNDELQVVNKHTHGVAGAAECQHR